MFIDERQPWGYCSQFRILRRRKREPIRQREKKNVNFNKLKVKRISMRIKKGVLQNGPFPKGNNKLYSLSYI